MLRVGQRQNKDTICCGLCGQSEGEPDKDAPPGHTVLVKWARDGGFECRACFYTRRGSFKPHKLHELIAFLEEQAVRAKFDGVRAENVKRLAENPGRRQRYEQVDVQSLVRRKEEGYIDFAEEI